MRSYSSWALDTFRLVRLYLCAASALLLTFLESGCGIIPAYTSINHPLGTSDDQFFPLEVESLVRPHEKTYAPFLENPQNPNRKTYPPLPHGVFIGIAISGGGSRAANFTAAVLQQLDQLGFLAYATAVSSVSGGSLSAAYYGLHQHPTAEVWANLRRLLRTDFFGKWLARFLLNPWNLLRYWFTDFDRSDIMAEVFDDVLYHKETFAKFGQGYPDILLNATDLATGERFVFVYDEFALMRSDLTSYPVARAVMASGAFPAVFNAVTLRNYSYAKPAYTHLIDGGPSDNLGIETLVDALGKVDSRVRGCFIFLVDAYNQAEAAGVTFKRDTRSSVDFLFDRNALNAIDSTFKNRRWSTLARLNLLQEHRDHPVTRQSATFSRFKPYATSDLECVVWHLQFGRLGELANEKLGRYLRKAINEERDYERTATYIDETHYDEALLELVLSVETHYRLVSRERCSAELAQKALYEAARVLVTEDDANLAKVQAWFRRYGLTVQDSPRYGPWQRLPIYLDLNQKLQCINTGEENMARPSPLRAEPLRPPPTLR